MRRCILSLTLIAYLTLSLSLASITTAKPVFLANNHNSIHHATKSSSHTSHNGLLKRLSSSWISLTTSPLQGLHAISGSLGPASNSVHSDPSKKLHKRGVDNNSRSIKKPTPADSGSRVKGTHKKKQAAGKATARARHTYSAYEAIVNSDSQMPVFLNQLHPTSTTKGNNGIGKGKGKPTSAAAASVNAAKGVGGEKRKKGAVTPIDILRQTGTKRPTAAAAATFSSTPSTGDEEREGERKEAEAELEGTSPAKKPTESDKELEGMTLAKEPIHQKKKNNNINRLSTVSRAVVPAAAPVEGETSTAKALSDAIFPQDLQQHRSHRTAESAIVSAGTAVGSKENSEDIKAIEETINAAVVAAISGSHYNTPQKSQHLEQDGTAGIMRQALENIAHKIEEAATAAIAHEMPSLTDHTLDSHSSAVSREEEAPLQDDSSAPMHEDHRDTIIDDEGAVDLPAITNNNNNHDNTAEESETSATKQKPAPIYINDSEYTPTIPEDEDPYAYTHPSLQDPLASSEYSDNDDEWRLSDDDDYMAQYVHRRPDNFPGSESILFTGTVLQRTLASSALLLSGFAVLLGVISYKMYARRRNTSPWAFLHYMTFGIFSSLFYDSAYMSNSTLNSYKALSPSTVSNSTMKKGPGYAPWLRKGSLTRSSNATNNNNNNNIMSFPAGKEPLLPEPVVASSSSSSASSLFKKSGPDNRSELRRTSTAQHHQMQIELALQQQQQREGQQQQQQAELDNLQKSFMRRTSI
ncbi:hypothetical protein BGZ96_005698 [Linnemannia gamsii]|uniref:Uncharacterized protein n=1 Tax=Linnemannia gamsii TaxID=64522 RepID=A0ABQ7KEG3_9FUNG|nr:hypothetical protein BGZ96_005698 [Linnemannia gamsii]